MKKIAVSIISVALLLTLVCGSAFALVGDITVKPAKAYADPNFTKYVGTIPKYTSVMVRAYGTYADVIVNGKECYVEPSALTQGKHDYDYIGTGTLVKGAKVYQRPSTAAKCLVNTKDSKVYVYAVNKGLAMIRTTGGVFGFVKADDIGNLKSIA